MKPVPRHHVVLRRSRQAAAWFAVPTFLTALLLWALPWPWWVLLIADLALVAWAAWSWRRLMPRGLPGGVEALTLDADRKLRLFFADDTEDDREEGVSACVLEETCLGDAFLTLAWRSEAPPQPHDPKRSRTLFLLPDMMAGDDWRCLRVLLRHGRDAKAEHPR